MEVYFTFLKVTVGDNLIRFFFFSFFFFFITLSDFRLQEKTKFVKKEYNDLKKVKFQT